MSNINKAIVVGALLSASVVATPAMAAKFLVSYTTGGNAASFTLTTTDDADANGFFEVTSMSGQLGAATDVALIGTVPFTAPDNLFKPAADYVTTGGISFSAGGVSYNLIHVLASRFSVGGIAQCVGGSCGAVITDFSVSAVTGAVPEPTSWAMMLIGFGLAAGATRYRRRSTNVSFA
jgi:hypothetical protein